MHPLNYFKFLKNSFKVYIHNVRILKDGYKNITTMKTLKSIEIQTAKAYYRLIVHQLIQDSSVIGSANVWSTYLL